MTRERTTLTDKAQRTRQHILDTALALFVANGYEATTMRDIASAADCSLGLAYRYYVRKEELILALYWQMAATTDEQIEQLPSGTIAERFYQLMVTRIEQSSNFRESFRALFAAAMNPDSGVSIFGDDTVHMHQQVREGFRSLVSGASDAPNTALVDDLAAVLYSIHFAVLLFWLYDRSASQRATADLLALIRDVLRLTRFLLTLPFAGRELARVARVTDGFFIAE